MPELPNIDTLSHYEIGRKMISRISKQIRNDEMTSTIC
jgi:hypothetical protein